MSFVLMFLPGRLPPCLRVWGGFSPGSQWDAQKSAEGGHLGMRAQTLLCSSHAWPGGCKQGEGGQQPSMHLLVCLFLLTSEAVFPNRAPPGP